MGTIRIEPEPPVKDAVCERCGGRNRLLHGYVYEDEYAHGVYFLEWCEGAHDRRAAFLTVSLGAFGDGTTASDRIAFCVEWRREGMALLDQPVRDRPELLGDFQPRDKALRLRNIDQLWHVVDHVVTDDPEAAKVQTWVDG